MHHAMATLDLRPASAADEDALVRFAAALPAGEPARAVIGDWWRCAASHPSGLRAWVAATEADERGPERVAAFVAVRGVRARIDGNECVFGELLAAAAHPLDRGSVRGLRLVADLARRHLETHCTPQADLVTYGLASDEGWRLMRHGLDVEILRRQPVLVAALAPAPAAAQMLPDGVREVPAFDGRVLALYDRCSSAWRASCVRDAATLAWRFPADGPYRRIAVGEEHGTLSGLAVAAPGAGGHLEVLDWLLPGDEVLAGELLHWGLSALARSLGLHGIRASLPPWSQDFTRFQERGFRVGPTSDFILARGAHRNLDVWWLRDHWWFQPFDVAQPRSVPQPAGAVPASPSLQG